jgi:mycofactocin precursor
VEKVLQQHTSVDERELAPPVDTASQATEEPGIVEDICVEELAIDGICGVY